MITILYILQLNFINKTFTILVWVQSSKLSLWSARPLQLVLFCKKKFNFALKICNSQLPPAFYSLIEEALQYYLQTLNERKRKRKRNILIINIQYNQSINQLLVWCLCVHVTYNMFIFLIWILSIEVDV